MDITLLSQIITYLVFGWLGYLLGKRFSVPDKMATWVLWLIALVLAGSIKFQIVNVFGFIIDSQSVLQALVAGILINFVVRTSRPDSPQASPSGQTKS